ncbi:30S ribosomal protein S8 [Candidatus Dojkabacteria bacterium]|nr:30S ribosomal protein S8 [Candidatus Dojkabacteria bacterium]
MVTDIVADTITRIYNGSLSKLDVIEVVYGKLVVGVLQILKDQGFITDFEEIDNSGKKSINVVLKYEDKDPIITGVKRVSSPGRRIYRSANQVRKVKQGLGVGIYSTSIGLMSDKDAYIKKVGGEYLCEVW